MINDFIIQDEKISKEFSGKTLQEIQLICENLHIEYADFEYDNINMIVIKNRNYLSFFISTDKTSSKYEPLKFSPVVK